MSICCFATRYVFATLKLDICPLCEQSIYFSLLLEIRKSNEASLNARIQASECRLLREPSSQDEEARSATATAVGSQGVYVASRQRESIAPPLKLLLHSRCHPATHILLSAQAFRLVLTHSARLPSSRRGAICTRSLVQAQTRFV